MSKETSALRRFTGEVVGQFGEALGITCDYCSEEAVLLPCNAEGDVGRAHHWCGVHDLSANRNVNLCETHGIEVLAENARIKIDRQPKPKAVVFGEESWPQEISK